MNKVIILAAGKGKRMNSDLPKVLSPINNRPMIEYLINSISKSKIDLPPIVVVSPDNKDQISKALSSYDIKYAIQTEQLGTGHAVLSAKDLVEEEVENIIVLYGDHPFYKESSIDKLIDNHKTEVSMMTVRVEDFNDWRKNFYHWGRIIKNGNEIKEIIEFKDASDEIKELKDVNPALFCFNKKWLFENIVNIKNNNNQSEYYLTDLIKLAFEQKILIGHSLVSPEEAVGVNSPEELEVARSLADKFIF